MSNTDIKIKLRRDTTANWQSVNPVLLQGEVGLEYNTTMGEVIGIKIGDGNTAWNDLEYVIGSKVPTGIDFDNLANNVHTDDTLTVKDNKLAINVDNSTYADGTALTWNPDTNEFVYKPVASSGRGFKNLIINGDFQVWQRGKSFTIVNNSMYTADRWMVDTQSESKVLRGELDTSQSTVDLCDPFGDGSCVATYQFDGNANDLCGNHNGTWHGNEQYSTGRFGQAAKFDGNSYVKVNSVPSLTDITISWWSSAEAGGYPFNFGKCSIEVVYTSTGVQVAYGDSWEWSPDISVNDITQLHFFALTYKASEKRIIMYVDGNEVWTDSGHSNAVSNISFWGFAARLDGNPLLDTLQV